ncbi:MAG: hypothetical protein ISS23_01310 [Nanoarchaeota archaeon]|nr:hypothetical protein [Nanoarchaeota archaeon]
MDKEKATRILTKELGDKIGRSVVFEDSYKDNLVKSASVIYQTGNPIFAGYHNGQFHTNTGSKNEIAELLLPFGDSFVEANYYFLKDIHIIGREPYFPRSRFAVTPYALIGEKEKDDLKKLFYKDVHPATLSAMDVLGIENYVELYGVYRNSDRDFFAILECCRFIDFILQVKYDTDNEISKRELNEALGKDINSLNAIFRKINISSYLSLSLDHPGYIHKKSLLEIVDQLKKKEKYIFMNPDYLEKDFLKGFFGFVFSLPYENQNVEANKGILSVSDDSDLVINVLYKEYSEGEFFEDYFDVLDEDLQKNVVDALKCNDLSNPVYNSFLWKKGFRNLDLDFLDLYKRDASGFIDYFSGKDDEGKKIILGDIMGYDPVNEEVVDWLDENESKLMKEVSFDGEGGNKT